MTKFKKSSLTPSRVLGIDPGFDRCGVAIIEKENGKEKLLYSVCLTTERTLSQAERIASVGEAVNTLIKKWRPHSLAIETLFFNINQRTALKVAEARGAVLMIAATQGLEIFEYSPQSVKIAVTGYGKAEKKAVETMVARILSLKKAPKHDDETDAMALCITHLASHRGL